MTALQKSRASYAKRHPDRVLNSHTKYYARNRDKIRARQKEYYLRNADHLRAKSRKHSKEYNPTRYGITFKEYNEMLVRQHGVCAICESRPGKRSLNIDHDHETGKVRALLCHGCNISLGHFEDNPQLLRTAADYVEKFREPDTQYRHFGELGSVSLVSSQIN